MIIAIDFDGTIVDHRYPEIGTPVPGAFHWMGVFQDHGARLVLWTMRSVSNHNYGDMLTPAVDFCRANGIQFWAINENPEQHVWTRSPKLFAHYVIDDHNAGCPLHQNPRMGGRPYVDWDVVGPWVFERILRN